MPQTQNTAFLPEAPKGRDTRNRQCENHRLAKPESLWKIEYVSVVTAIVIGALNVN